MLARLLGCDDKTQHIYLFHVGNYYTDETSLPYGTGYGIYRTRKRQKHRQTNKDETEQQMVFDGCQ